MPPHPFCDADLPPLYHAADKSSADAQRRFLLATRIRLIGLVAAAAFGLFTWTSGASPIDWAGVLAVCCFSATLIVEIYILSVKPERTWYEGRAAAESVKTLSWRYVVGGEPFNIGGERSASEIDDLFLQQLRSILGVLRDLDLTALPVTGKQISDRMCEVRSAPLAERKAVYEMYRVGDQQEWYATKARWNSRQATYWTVVMIAIEIAGVTAGVLKAIGLFANDLLIFAGTLIATITAWLQTKQHRTLGTAYAVTALELASVASTISHQQTEPDWAEFVGDAEEAFSREHTLWKASRGVQSI